MKQKLNRLTRSYVNALRKHVKLGSGSSLRAAVRIGRHAVAMGLETLALARIHEGAVEELDLAGRNHGTQQRAVQFFTESTTPIVETHRAARQSKLDVSRLNEVLSQRTIELAETHRKVRQGISHRKSVESALKRSGENYARQLKESLQLQARLRRLTHEVLAAQEDERREISRELQNEIAQTLLGINVRLLTLKQQALNKTKGLRTEIASTQRLVEMSARTVRRAARGFTNE